MYAGAWKEAQRGHQTPWHWGYKWLWAIMWVLGTESGAFAKAVITLSWWAIFPAPYILLKMNVMAYSRTQGNQDMIRWVSMCGWAAAQGFIKDSQLEVALKVGVCKKLRGYICLAEEPECISSPSYISWVRLSQTSTWDRLAISLGNAATRLQALNTELERDHATGPVDSVVYIQVTDLDIERESSFKII